MAIGASVLQRLVSTLTEWHPWPPTVGADLRRWQIAKTYLAIAKHDALASESSVLVRAAVSATATIPHLWISMTHIPAL